MNIKIRKEHPKDYEKVFRLIEAAFADLAKSDHTEQFLVKRLRDSEAFIPELSLVATIDEQIVGHIILTKITIQNDSNIYQSLALAPVSVLPEYQNIGIGGTLIKSSHEIARALGFQSIVLLGHAHYYPKFGYLQAHKFGISLPFEAPPENCMVIELFPHSLQGIHGKVVYPREFYG